MKLGRFDNICLACATQLGAKLWPREVDNIRTWNTCFDCAVCGARSHTCEVRDWRWPKGMPEEKADEH